MGLRTVGDPFGGPAPLIDRWLGAAWPIVKAVYDNLSALQRVLTLITNPPLDILSNPTPIILHNLPTSDTGLVPGQVWKNGDILCIKS